MLERLRRVDVPSTLALAALSATTALSMCRLFPDWEFLAPMLLAVLGVHVVAALLRALRVPALAAGPLLAASVVELVVFSLYRSTMHYGIPSGQTLTLLRADLQTVADQFSTAVAPVPSNGAFAVVTTAVLALCAGAADTFAFRGRGRLESIVPTGAMFIVVAALGTDRNRLAVSALWIFAAFLVVALLRFRQSDDSASWMSSRPQRLLVALPSLAVTAAIVALAAVVVAPRLPGVDGEALIDTHNPQQQVTQVLSPMVDIGGKLRDRTNSELFTVRSSDGPHYWRVIGLPNFDGRSWEPGEEALQPLGDRTALVPPGHVVQQIVHILNLGGHLVPAAHQPIGVSPDVIKWADESQSLVLSGSDLQTGDEIAITSSITDLTPDLLRASTVGSAPATVYYSLPADTPVAIGQLAGQITDGAPTAYDAALMLQNWFRSEFTYDLEVDYGNDLNAIEAFLTARRGFCQQFAGTFAVMARALGIPTRVAVGFTPGDLGSDGLYHVFDRHAHAWPEVWFDGVGWVPFEPTPGRGSADSTSYTGVDPAQVAPIDDPVATTTTTITDSTVAPTTTDGSAPSTTVASGAVTTTVAGAGGSGGGATTGIAAVILVLLALVVGWITVVPRVARRRALHHDRSPAGRIEAAWRRAIGALSLLGAPAVGGSTPLEYVDVVAAALDVPVDDLHHLALLLTSTVYSRATIDDGDARRADAHADAIDALVDARLDRATAMQLRVDPRLIAQRLGER